MPAHFSLFGIPVYYYGLLYVLWYLVVLVWLQNTQRTHNVSKESVQDVLFWTFLCGIIGGRLGYALFYNTDFFLSNPLSLFETWKGGMSIHGGMLGGFIAFFVITRKKGIDTWRLLDSAVVPLTLALALGRFGNYLNNELPGRIAENTYPWVTKGDLHPYTVYAIIKDLFLFVDMCVLSLQRAKLKTGTMTCLFGMLYSVARCITEFTRQPEIFYSFGLSQGQVLSLVLFITCSVGFVWRQKVGHFPVTHQTQA